MQKGKFGVSLSFYAVLAFVLAILDQTLLCGLLLAFVIAAEKNEWVDRQVMQAFFLNIFYTAFTTVFGSVTWYRTYSYDLSSYFSGMSAWSIICNVIVSIVAILVLVFAIIAIVNVSKGKEANIPGLSTLAFKAMGLIPPRAVPPVPPQYPQNPQYPPYQQNGQPPVPPMPPQQPPVPPQNPQQ